MKSFAHLVRTSVVAATLAFAAGSALAAPLTSEITYQGEVRSGGVPASGNVDLRFRLFDAAAGGANVGVPVEITRLNVALVDGKFTTQLDFGAATYAGEARWLEIDVRTAGGGAYTTLNPRQPLTASPYARFAPNAGVATTATTAALAANSTNLNGQPGGFYQNANNLNAGTLPSARFSGAYTNAITLSNAANVFVGNGAGLTGLNASNISGGTLADGLLSSNVALLNRVNQTFTQRNLFTGGSDASLVSGTGFIQVGLSSGINLGIDSNEIQARNGSGAASNLFLNAQGGNIFIGSGGASLVGIGTTTPERSLHIFEGSAGIVTSNANTVALFEDDTNSYVSILTPDANESGILFGSPVNPQDGGIIFGNSATDRGLQFRTNGNNTRLSITNTGDVGIGTTAPTTDFELARDLSTTFKLRSGANQNITIDFFENLGIGGNGARMIYNGATNNTFTIGTVSGGTATTALSISRGNPDVNFSQDITVPGAISVGTTAQATKLLIEGGSEVTTTVGTGYAQFGSSAGINLGIDTNEIQVRTNAGAATSLFLNAQGGNVFIGSAGTSLVGIGTAAPERFLHVFGGSAGTVTSNAGSLAVFENSANAYLNLLTPTANESGILFGTPTNAQEGGIIYGNAAVGGNGLQFRTNGNNTRMIITGTGTTIIGEVGTPEGQLDVTSNGIQVMTVNRNTNDGVLIDFERSDLTQGSINVTAGIVSISAFTGTHYAKGDQAYPVGTLVKFTGANTRLGDDPTREIVYGFTQSSTANDPAVIGVALGTLPAKELEHSTDVDLVAAVGNGDMWVVDTGANLEPGDYLISSDTPGAAMKDDPSKFPIGHVVARVAEKVDWAKVQPDEKGVKKAKISVLFGNFTRSSPAPLEDTAAAVVIAEQQRKIDDLEARLQALERLMNR